jgi:hypothetical protein
LSIKEQLEVIPQQEVNKSITKNSNSSANKQLDFGDMDETSGTGFEQKGEQKFDLQIKSVSIYFFNKYFYIL